jgi:hypothetical protein
MSSGSSVFRRLPLLRWKKEQGGKSPFLFPSPVKPDQPITTVKTAWTTTLKNAGVAHFPICHLRHVFCTRLSWVAPDAIVQRAMRHSSPETKRHYQLGMLEQVRRNLEKANEKVYGKGEVLRFHDGQPAAGTEEEMTASKCNDREGESGAPGGTRTPDPLLRRQMLYPAELRARSGSYSDSKAFAAIPKTKSSSFSRYCVTTVPQSSLTGEF